MNATTEQRDARVSPKALARLFPVLAMIAVLGGCGAMSGPPDASGVWEGEVVFPDEDAGTLILALDLQQAESGALSGTMRYTEEGSSPDEGASMPITGGSVTDEGDMQVVAQQEAGLDAVTMNVQGRIEGDSMDARFSADGPELNYDAERITEEEYQARMEERRQAYEAEQEEQRQALEEQNLEAARYEEAAKVAGDQAQDIEARLAVIEGPYGGGPSEQLQEALGPADPGGDLYACSASGGASCEVAGLEERLQNDHEDVEEAASDDYAPDVCSTVDFGYYEDYDLASAGGSDYARVSDELRTASEGLGEDADAALEKAREAEAARAAYEEAGGSPASPTYSVDEVEAMADDAGDAEQATEGALASAGERWAGYERRVDEVVREAQALQDSAGC